MIKEHEQVVLTVDLPGHDFEAGDVGVVVHVYGDSEAYELEIFSLDGRTLDVVTVESAQVRPVGRRDIRHIRERSA